MPWTIQVRPVGFPAEPAQVADPQNFCQQQQQQQQGIFNPLSLGGMFCFVWDTDNK